MTVLNKQIQIIYYALFHDDSDSVISGLTQLRVSFDKLISSTSVLDFSDWMILSDIQKSNPQWLDIFIRRLIYYAFEFDLPNCAEMLILFNDFLSDEKNFLSVLDIAIENTSIKCIDILIKHLGHPDAELYLGGPTMLAHTLSKGNKIIANYLYDNYNVHPDGLKTLVESGFREKYDDVIQTMELNSVLSYIIISELEIPKKLEMLQFAMTNGANIKGHSPTAECFDHPIQVAASVSAVIMEYLLDMEVGLDANEPGRELIFSAVRSKAPFEEKKKIIDSLYYNYGANINLYSPNLDNTPVTWAVAEGSTDCVPTVKYLMSLGAVVMPDSLLKIATKNRHYRLRDEIYRDRELECSEEVYIDCLEMEKVNKAEYSHSDGNGRIFVIFPEKVY